MISVGKYLGSRIVEAGCTHVFGVAGDYNLSLLGELNTEPGLQLVSTCNELNGGYAADGFARGSQTLAVLVVTYMVCPTSTL
jgi:TPP-dependent 2-oxoacid decarboxylase